MMTAMYKWFVPGLAFVIGLLIVAAELGAGATPAQAAIAFGIMAIYAVALRLLQSRSDTASLLSGIPVDERWASINGRALSLAAQVVAIALVIGFLVTRFGGGDAVPYAWVGAVFGVAYLGGIAWYRWRS
ncbi:MAG TPA: DUF2178 domain-containing protein [Candidatus Limnocylindrales bacterium]